MKPDLYRSRALRREFSGWCRWLARTIVCLINIAKSGQRQVIMRFASPAQVSSEMNSPFKGNPFAEPAAQHK